MTTSEQTIFINIDDSGKLSLKEQVCGYGAIVFLSKKEKDKFITQYRSIIKSIRCKYCNLNKDTCCFKCPEVKSVNIKNSDRRRIINYLKKYYKRIIEDKASKGRYLDYVLKLFIKGIIVDQIKKGQIDVKNKLTLILNIDEQSTKSNGYYTLKAGLLEELVHGIINFNYNNVYKPILSNLDIRLTYQKSDKSYVVQAADMIAGLVRRKALESNSNVLYDFIDYKLFLP